MLSRGHLNWAFHLNDPDAKRTMMWVFGPWNQANRDPIDNAPVELVCQATSAAPTYFPPVEFTLTDTGKEPHRAKTFSLIDGSLAINNPTGVAITQAIKEVQTDSAKGRVKYKSFSDLLVLSLGTGQHPMGHSAREATGCSLILCPKAPWDDSVLNATADMVDLNISLLFQSEKAGANYLRIQTDRLTRSFASIDTCGHEHLSQVTALGMQLLDEPVMQHDFKTGKLVPVADGVTNREALYR
jgi:patatin-like phospholipase/acyl hydrolase